MEQQPDPEEHCRTLEDLEIKEGLGRANDRAIDVPTMNRKKGKIRSVGVQPCQGACRSGA
jgi:hypothetical protein